MNEPTRPEGLGPEWIPAPPPKAIYSCAISDLKPLIQLLVSDTTDFNALSVLSGDDGKAFSLLKAGSRVHLTFVTRHGGPLGPKIADLLLQHPLKKLHTWRVGEDYEMSAYETPCVENALFSICRSILTTAFDLAESETLRVKFY